LVVQAFKAFPRSSSFCAEKRRRIKLDAISARLTANRQVAALAGDADDLDYPRGVIDAFDWPLGTE
jgi:hypothetical protein